MTLFETFAKGGSLNDLKIDCFYLMNKIEAKSILDTGYIYKTSMRLPAH
jgi:hypothetical protein